MIVDLFPTPVGRYSVGRKFTEEEMQFVSTQSTYENTGNLTSNDTKVLHNLKLSNLRRIVEEKLKEYFESVYQPKDSVQLYITQSWINYTKEKQFHHKHNHPNSFLSGIVYLNTKQNEDKIVFFKNEVGQLKIKPTEWNVWNSDSWWLGVNAGDVLIFPSYLTHMVETVTHDVTRTSLAFNTFLVGDIGDEQDLTRISIGGSYEDID